MRITRMNLLRILPFTYLAFLMGCTEVEKSSLPKTDIAINVNEAGIGDSFSQPFLRMLRETASSSQRGISVSFNRANTSIIFLFRDLEEWSSIGISIDTPHIYLDYDRIEVDDEVLNDTEFRERLSLYREAAEMTDSSAAFILSASPGVSISSLTDHLTTISESGVNVLLLQGNRQGTQ